ncbi:unnamed protein product [Amoebophrya sp. A120]|nr:unnamed protein product [Amoebophrya sp. A120]|eukprot:GSA120T00004180001.1
MISFSAPRVLGVGIAPPHQPHFRCSWARHHGRVLQKPKQLVNFTSGGFLRGKNDQGRTVYISYTQRITHVRRPRHEGAAELQRGSSNVTGQILTKNVVLQASPEEEVMQGTATPCTDSSCMATPGTSEVEPAAKVLVEKLEVEEQALEKITGEKSDGERAVEKIAVDKVEQQVAETVSGEKEAVVAENEALVENAEDVYPPNNIEFEIDSTSEASVAESGKKESFFSLPECSLEESAFFSCEEKSRSWGKREAETFFSLEESKSEFVSFVE